MFFNVVRMYDSGARKDSESLMTEIPVMGDLQVSMATANGQVSTRDSMVAALRRSATGQDLLPPLYDARLKEMVGTEFTLSGLEQDGERFLIQAWHCRQIED